MTDLFRPDVIAGKYDPALFDPTGRALLVNEVFYSLQGEGFWTGHATVFVRLAKCNLACKFCDTEFETFTKQNVEDVVEKILSLCPSSEDAFVAGRLPGKALAGPDFKHRPRIDLTGGEPLLQNCKPLIIALQVRGFEVGVETSGSVYADWIDELDWITLSPKVPLANVPLRLREEASEVKWVLNAAFLTMYDRAPASVFHPGCVNFLQPESNNPKFITAATKLIMRHPSRYVLSLQTHKLAGNP